MKIYLQIFVIFISVIIGGCIPHNNQFGSYQPSYATQPYNLSCTQLKRQLKQLNYQKTMLHKDDKFKFKYMLVLPAISETIRISKNESRIKKEIRQTNKLIIENQCNRYRSTLNNSSTSYDQYSPTYNNGQNVTAPEQNYVPARIQQPQKNYNWNYTDNYQSNSYRSYFYNSN